MADPYMNLNPSFSARLQAFITASNGLVRPGSGYRTNEQQAQLYNAYKSGVPGQARAAPPGKSQHNHGLAMDLTYGKGGREWAHQHAAEYGLYFPMSDEPWHIQPAGMDDHASHPGVKGLQAAGIDPQDELASRVRSIMNIMVGADPSTPLTDDAGNEIARDPNNSRYMANIFESGGTSPKALNLTDVGDPKAYGQYALSKFKDLGWNQAEYAALVELWNRESGNPKAGSSQVTWNPAADNPKSTAQGIAQKMQSVHGPIESTYQGQIDWGLNYIQSRYSSPTAALKFHNTKGWY